MPISSQPVNNLSEAIMKAIDGMDGVELGEWGVSVRDHWTINHNMLIVRTLDDVRPKLDRLVREYREFMAGRDVVEFNPLPGSTDDGTMAIPLAIDGNPVRLIASYQHGQQGWLLSLDVQFLEYAPEGEAA